MERLGKYQITGELGTGGFGKVYKALDPTVGRVVAIKVLNVQDDVLVKRFRVEATTSASLQHRNIVTIHEFGEDRGQQFLVMEYLDGRSLQRLIGERTPLSMLDKLLIMSEVSQGLQYAHAHGVIHRDVKPANIMWLSDGSVKVMDFGIARLMEGAGTRLTQTGSIIGTLQYMSPEQFSTDTAGAQCDIWAYGVVLYEFLSGTNPFDAVSPSQVMFRVTNDDPLAAFPLPDPPGSLMSLLKRLLAKSQRDRYPTMEEAQLDLDLVIHELKEGQIENLVFNAGALIREERLGEALSVVRRILELDQSNSAARQWRMELTERVRTQTPHVRVRELIELAQAHVSAREFDGAGECLGEALGLDPNNRSVRVRLEEIRIERERIRHAAALVAQARVELQQQALTNAFEHATQAAEADPRNREALALIDQARAALARRESETHRQSALARVKGLILVEDYAGASLILQDLMAQYPADLPIQRMLDEARRREAAHAARIKVERAIAESKEMIRRGFYQSAIDLLSGIDRQLPEVAALLTYAREQLDREAAEARRRGEELRASEERARAMLLAGNLDEAGPRTAGPRASDPPDPGVAAVHDEVSRRVQEKREQRKREAESLIERGRASALGEAIADIQQLLSRGQVGNALAAANSALARFPGEPGIAQLRQTALDRQMPAASDAGDEGSNLRVTPDPDPEPAPDRKWLVVVGGCVLLAAVLLALFLLRR